MGDKRKQDELVLDKPLKDSFLGQNLYLFFQNLYLFFQSLDLEYLALDPVDPSIMGLFQLVLYRLSRDLHIREL